MGKLSGVYLGIRDVKLTASSVLYNTFSPAFYIDYFRVMAAMAAKAEGGKLTPKIAKDAMERYATLQLGAISEW